MKEQKLLALLLSRDESALDILAQQFGKQLHRTAYNVLNSCEDAEEIVSDTYLALWNAIPPAKPESLEAYAHRTARNLALKKYRFQSAQKRNSHFDLSLDELAGALPDTTTPNTISARELGQAINRFLDTLSRQNRILFMRRYWFGDTVGQLAQEFSLTENTVSVRLNRIRSKLKDYLIKEGFFL